MKTLLTLVMIISLMSSHTPSRADEVARKKKILTELSESWGEANRHLKEGGTPGDEEYIEMRKRFRETLQSHIQMFPEITPLLRAGTNQFQKISLNKAGAGFDAVKFKNDTNEERKLLWAFARPEKSAMSSWFIERGSGTMRGFRRFSQGSSTYPETPWPETGYRTILQTLTSDSIKPGEEYILWFAFADTKPEDFYIAVNVLPANDWLDGLYLQEIGLGLRNPPEPNKASGKPAGENEK